MSSVVETSPKQNQKGSVTTVFYLIIMMETKYFLFLQSKFKWYLV
jgi:hypothetical protein